MPAIQRDKEFLRRHKQHIEFVPLILTYTAPQLSLFISFVIKRPQGIRNRMARCDFALFQYGCVL